MAKGNFAVCLPFTLAYEGGYSTDKRDPGNWTGGKVRKGVLKGTKKGISAKAYPNLDIANLSDEQIAQIYDRNYWQAVHGDDLPFGVDLATFDAGVQSGPGRGIRWLQGAIGAGVDGNFGPETRSKLGYARVNGKTVINRICDSRIGFFHTLAIWTDYSNGLASRVAKCRGASLAMWLRYSGRSAASQKDTLEQEAGTRAKTAANQNKVATGGAVAGGGTVTADQTDVTHIFANGWVLAGFVVLAVLLVVYLASRARVNRQTAEALGVEAAKIKA